MRLVILVLMLVTAGTSGADDPKCDNPNGWASNMAFVHMKNAFLVDNTSIDFTKTQVVRLASEKIGADLYRQVHEVTFTDRTGKPITAVTVNDASHEECSMSGVEVFVVSRKLGGLK